jgi:hypothetical protein
MDTNLCLAQKYGSMGNGVYLFQNMGHILPNVVIRNTAHTFDAPTSLHCQPCSEIQICKV